MEMEKLIRTTPKPADLPDLAPSLLRDLLYLDNRYDLEVRKEEEEGLWRMCQF